MPELKINRDDLQQAFGMSTEEGAAYLDLQTGAVLIVASDQWSGVGKPVPEAETLDAALALIAADSDIDDWERSMLADAARIEYDTEARYLLIPQQDSRDGYGDMRAFIDRLDDERLADLLDVAIQGRGAFRRFKDVLLRYPDAEQAWFQFRDAREWQRVLDWLESEDVVAEFESG